MSIKTTVIWIASFIKVLCRGIIPVKKWVSRPTIYMCYELSTLHLSTEVMQIINSWITDTEHILLLVAATVSQSKWFFHTPFGWAFQIVKPTLMCRRLAAFAHFYAYVGRTRPREGHRAGPPRMRLRQAGTLAEDANEKSRFPSRKGPRSTESARISIQMITRFCISYLCLLFCRIRSVWYTCIILVYFAAVLRYKGSGFCN